MKILPLFLIFLLGVTGISAEGTTRVSLLSSPENVQVRLDSVLLGRTPLLNVNVQPGTHRLEALSPYDGWWNMTNVVKTFTVKDGADTTIRIYFRKKVEINSIPYHAKLVRQNKNLGRTPLVVPFEENKGKEFQLEKEGYHSFRFVLQKPESQLFKLEPIDLSSAEQTTFTRDLFHKRLKTKFLFLSGTVVTHWLAFYLKNVADDNFEKYGRTADTALMDKYWNNTQKFDRYSNISLGISYALLSGLIYTVIWR